MDKISILDAYRRYESIYDIVFGSLLDPGRKLLVERINGLPVRKVLEVGVGTGISLSYYAHHISVVGLDVSPHMLGRAKQRVHAKGLKNVALHLMDAEDMNFPDGHFDSVAAMYIVSVTPDPFLLISQMKRVCRDGGDLFILNHFSHRNGLIRTFEKALSPLAKVIGFSPVFPLDRFIAGCALTVVEVARVNAFGYWTLIHAKNDPVSPASAGNRPC